MTLLRVILIATVGLVLLWWTWGRFGDAYIDFGKELHVAWRVSEGAVLYRDVEYLYGPLPVWVNAVWFRLFGASIRTLLLCNAALLVLTTLLLYRILRRFAGPWPTTAAVVLFLLLFGFGNLVGFANYNYLTPYAQGMTHGMLLVLLIVWALARWLQRAAPPWLALAGAAAGLAVFTKPEMGAAALATTGIGVAVVLWKRPREYTPSILELLVCAGSFVVALALVLGLMMLQLDARAALRGTFASYLHILDPQITSTKFYRVGIGLEHPSRSLGKVLVWCSYYGRAFIPPALAALMLPRFLRRGESAARIAAVVVALAGFAVVWFARFELRWTDAFRGITAVMLILDLILVVMLFRSSSGASSPIIVATLLAIPATVLLAKMALNVRIYQYGFVLAMPCVVLVVVALLDWAPRLLRRAGGDGRLFAAAAMGILSAVTLVHVQASARNLSSRDVQISSGANPLLASGANGRMLKDALDELSRRLRPGDTLAALPEGATFNFLLHRRNPTPFDQLTPIGARVFGEARVTESFREHPPDWIVLVHQDTSVFGGRYLGEDYLAELGRWIDSNYTEVWRAGERPLESLSFGISILQKTEAARE